MANKERSGSEEEEKTRPARAGETGLTRFGMEKSSVADIPATGGPTPGDENTSEEDER